MKRTKMFKGIFLHFEKCHGHFEDMSWEIISQCYHGHFFNVTGIVPKIVYGQPKKCHGEQKKKTLGLPIWSFDYHR